MSMKQVYGVSLETEAEWERQLHQQDVEDVRPPFFYCAGVVLLPRLVCTGLTSYERSQGELSRQPAAHAAT